MNKQNNRITVYDGPDGRFRDRLKLDDQTGSLTITNSMTEHAGVYELHINSVIKSFSLTVNGAKYLSVETGKSVTLNSLLNKIKKKDVIEWNFGYNGYTLIAEINKQAKIITVYDDVLDGRFRDRLKLNKKTGSLSITNISTEHAGVYDLQYNYIRKLPFILTVFGVFGDSDEVRSLFVMEDDSVTLNSGLTEIQTDDEIEWRFGHTNLLIAELSMKSSMILLYDGDDGRFRDRLKLDHQTGSLTITNITTTDSGVFTVNIISKSREIRYRFNVTVYGVLGDSDEVRNLR
ncbi:hypothetical protein cypCar_00045541 [Cyprinus carpio]|nr:hypothetical protein cypCar_00045541 [Cyprinus carpio]